jgi:CheY-like chemotaxis protein
VTTEATNSKTHHILVMDDEPSVRGLLNKFLQTCGYRVTVASEGMEAYELYKASMESDQPVDAIIMDLLVNDGLGGLDSFRMIRQANPEAIGIVSSAYSEDNAMAEYQKHGFSAVLAKPYQLLDLKRILEELCETDLLA